MGVTTVHCLVPKQKGVYVPQERLDNAVAVVSRILHEYAKQVHQKEYKRFLSNLEGGHPPHPFPLYGKEELAHFNWADSHVMVAPPRIAEWDVRYNNYLALTQGEEKYFIYPKASWFKERMRCWTLPYMSLAFLPDDSLCEDLEFLYDGVDADDRIIFRCGECSLDLGDWLKGKIKNGLGTKKHKDINQMELFDEPAIISSGVGCPCGESRICLGDLELDVIVFTNLYIELPRETYLHDENVDWELIFPIIEEILGIELDLKTGFLI